VKNKSFLKINQKVKIALNTDNDFMDSLIQELSGKTLSVTIPARKDEPLILRNGDIVSVRFFVYDAAYSFTASVLGHTKSNNVPLVVISRPTAFKRLQRRDYVRIPVTKPILFTVPCTQAADSKTSSYKGTVIDISGGGIKIFSSSVLSEGDKVEIEFMLSDAPQEKMCLQGTVVWAERDMSSKKRFGIRFTDIHENQREKIISYIFSKMRQRPPLV